MSRNSILTDAIKENISILDYAQQIGLTPKKFGHQYTLVEHDSVRIDPESRVFYRHSNQHGGSVIDFSMEFEELTKDEAIRKLRGYLSPSNLARAEPVVREVWLPKEKHLELPKQVEGKFSRVFAYLTKSRDIDPGIVSELIKRKNLYEDEHHNCTFVGYDEKKKAAFACVRGTLTNTDKPYRGDCPGSDKAVGWYINNKARALVITEAPIDAMSFMSMLKLSGFDHHKFNFLALGGTATLAVERILEKGDHGIQKVYLATDNDKAGNEARSELRALFNRFKFQGKVIDKVPIAKDWNDDLKAFRANHPERNISQGQQPTKINQQKERGLSYEQGA